MLIIPFGVKHEHFRCTLGKGWSKTLLWSTRVTVIFFYISYEDPLREPNTKSYCQRCNIFLFYFFLNVVTYDWGDNQILKATQQFFPHIDKLYIANTIEQSKGVT